VRMTVDALMSSAPSHLAAADATGQRRWPGFCSLTGD
jgi:hypothetical protein